MGQIDIDDFKRDLPGLLEVDDHQSVIDGFNQIHEAYHALIQMVKPAMGPTYQVQKQAEENPKTTFTVRFTYSDEGGEGWLEPGDIFRNVDHTVISHH